MNRVVRNATKCASKMSSDTEISLSDNEEAVSPKGWDRRMEKNLIKIGNLAGAFNRALTQTAYTYAATDYGFFLVTLIISVIPVLMSSINIHVRSFWLDIVTAIFGAMVTIVGGAHLYLKLTEKISAQRAAAQSFRDIFARAYGIMWRKHEDRPEANEFVTAILKEYNDAFSASPGVWSCLLQRHINNLPDRCDITLVDTKGMIRLEGPPAARRSRLRKHRKEEEEVIKKQKRVGIWNRAQRNWELDRYYMPQGAGSDSASGSDADEMV